MHESDDWGVSSLQYVSFLSWFIVEHQIRQLLDYGAGQQNLAKILPRTFPRLEIHSYDPGVKAISHAPDPAEFVCCIDVLEHVEPNCVDAVLDDLVRVTKRLGFFTVGTEPAGRILPDGRNAHLTIQPLNWWREKIYTRFSVLHDYDTQHAPWIIVQPKSMHIECGHIPAH